MPFSLYCGTAFFLVVADEWARSCAGLILSLIKTQSRPRVAWLSSDKDCCSRRFVTRYSVWNERRGLSNTSMLIPAHALQMSKCRSWRSFVSVKLANNFITIKIKKLKKKWRHNGCFPSPHPPLSCGGIRSTPLEFGQLAPTPYWHAAHPILLSQLWCLLIRGHR